MESEETDTINIDINDVDEQVFENNIKQTSSEKYWYVFNSNDVSEEEIKKLKTILFCCNTKFFLNKDNTDYNKPEILSNAVSVLQEKLVKDAVLLKELAQQNGAKNISIQSPLIKNIGNKMIVSGINFKDDKNNEYLVQHDANYYWKHYPNKNNTIGHANVIVENELRIMHGEFIDSVHAKGTYMIISKTQVEGSTANQITIDICYNYKNNNAPNTTVGGGSVFRIKLLQEKGKYTLQEIKKGDMKEDKVDETSLKEAQISDIRGIIDNEEQGKSLRETLAEEPELCKVLQEAKVISKERYQSIINPHIKKQINGKLFIISKKLLEAELSQSQGESMQDDNYNNSQNKLNTEQLQSSKMQSNCNNTSQQLPDSKERDNSERPPNTNANTADVKHNYNFLCLKDTWIGKNKTTGKYGCCGCDCC